jgi:excisionase family DNA binding protein
MADSLAEYLKSLIREVIREELQALGSGKPESLLVDTQGAADLLKVPPSWVAMASRRGEIKCVRLGHHVRFKREDIEQLCIQNSGHASPAKVKRQTRKSSAADAADGSAAAGAGSAKSSFSTRSDGTG